MFTLGLYISWILTWVHFVSSLLYQVCRNLTSTSLGKRKSPPPRENVRVDSYNVWSLIGYCSGAVSGFILCSLYRKRCYRERGELTSAEVDDTRECARELRMCSDDKAAGILVRSNACTTVIRARGLDAKFPLLFADANTTFARLNGSGNLRIRPRDFLTGATNYARLREAREDVLFLLFFLFSRDDYSRNAWYVSPIVKHLPFFATLRTSLYHGSSRRS